MATCTYTVPDKNASGDNFYGAVICNQVYVDYFWNTYGFSGNKVYWDDGWGWDDCCNTRTSPSPAPSTAAMRSPTRPRTT